MSEFEKSYSTSKWVRIVLITLLGVITAVFFAFVFGLFVKLLWNWLMPDLFNLKEISYWQAFGIVLLARLIFGSIGEHHGHHHKKNSNWENQYKHSYCHGKWNIKDGWKGWRHYDEWWKVEGKTAFEDFIDKKNNENQ